MISRHHHLNLRHRFGAILVEKLYFGGGSSKDARELSAVWDDFTHEEWHRFIDYLVGFERGVRRTRGEQAPQSRIREGVAECEGVAE